MAFFKDQNQECSAAADPDPEEGQSLVSVRSSIAGAFSSVRRTFAYLQDGVCDTVCMSKQTVRAAKNAELITRIGVIKRVISGGAVVVACIMTVNGAAAGAQITAHTLAIFLCIVFDPLEMLSRVLAPQSRFIAGADLAFITILRFFFTGKLLLYFLIWLLISSLLVMINNRHWLESHLWLWTEATQEAFVCDEGNAAFIAWQEYGKRESRSLLAQVGLQFDESTLNSYGKTLYMLGYKNGYIKEASEYDLEDKLQRAQSAAVIAQEEQRLLQEEWQNRYNELQQASDAKIKELQSWKNKELQRRKQEEEAAAARSADKAAELEAEEAAQKPLELVIRAAELLQAGYSIRKAAEALNGEIKPYRVTAVNVAIQRLQDGQSIAEIMAAGRKKMPLTEMELYAVKSAIQDQEEQQEACI